MRTNLKSCFGILGREGSSFEFLPFTSFQKFSANLSFPDLFAIMEKASERTLIFGHSAANDLHFHFQKACLKITVRKDWYQRLGFIKKAVLNKSRYGKWCYFAMKMYLIFDSYRNTYR